MKGNSKSLLLIRLHVNTLISLIVGEGVSLAFGKNCQNKLKSFGKTKRIEALKWYFLHSPGQEEQFKLYLTPSQGALKNFY